MPKKPPAPKGCLNKPAADELLRLIRSYTDAAISESWSGGGHPSDVPVLEAERALAEVRLLRFVEKLQEEDS